MPRPPKHVPPETLGGRIRAAREHLGLSLARVAGNQYSTSLISQIERNRVEPSEKSLEFLAEQLQLSVDELKILAQRQRDAEVQEHQDHVYEKLHKAASQALSAHRPHDALKLLKELDFPRIPSALRWRLAALRGQCYFSTREFLSAQKDFLYAITEQPLLISTDQHLEAMALHLHLAAAFRELEQPDAAFAQFQVALTLMNSSTSLNYIAETHWGMSLIASQRAKKTECSHYKEEQLQLALSHATEACALYHSIREEVQVALLTCHMSLIQQAQGKLAVAREELCKLLCQWQAKLEQAASSSNDTSRHVVQLSNLVSAVACSLAGVEYEAENFTEALTYAQQAIEVGRNSNVLRQAEAVMMYGRILEAQDPKSPEVEAAFREATTMLAHTKRLAARIRAHDLLGRHLLKKGDTKTGEAELDRVRYLSNLGSVFSSSTIGVDSENDNGANHC